MNTYEENFAKAFDVNAIQESFKNMFDLEKYQAAMKDFYKEGAYQENADKFFSDTSDAYNGVKEYVESLVDQEQVQKNVELGANLIAVNTNAVTDAVTLKTMQVREGIEGALKQVNVLAKSKDLKEAAEAQQAYVKSLQEELSETTWINLGLVTGLVESNISLMKEGFDQLNTSKKTA
jgi:hypothetical protein